jgi:hypothetical protein
MRPNAQTADLIASLREFVASADGDKPSAAPARRDSPGARSAAAAGAHDGNTGQRTTPVGRSRRDTLPDDHQVAVGLAEGVARRPGQGDAARPDDARRGVRGA